MFIPTLEELIAYHDGLIDRIEKEKKTTQRAKGGIERAIKGELVEFIARGLVERVWKDINGKNDDICTHLKGKISVSLKKDYLQNVVKDKDIENYIKGNIDKYIYKISIDVPIFIRKSLVLAIECKAFTENAMMKRILFDGFLIREKYPEAGIVLFQLESQLGGDYSQIFNPKIFGSPSTHTLMSYYDYKLDIITLLEGERSPKKPIHKPEYFKEIKMESLKQAYQFFKLKLKPHVNR